MNGEAAARLARVQGQGEDLARPRGDRADIRWLCALVRELDARCDTLAGLIASHRAQGNGDGHGPDNRMLWDGADAVMNGGQP